MSVKKTSFADEVNNLLGDFFGDPVKTEPPPPPPKKTPAAPQKPPLYDLKEIILSIDWEISDAVIKRLIVETDRLMKIYQGNKFIHSLLKLLDSVGRYVYTNKNASHPDALKLLHSIHADLQKVAAAKQIPEALGDQILSAQIARFNDLRHKLLEKTKPVSDPARKPPAVAKPAPTQTATPIRPAPAPVPPKKVPTAGGPDPAVDLPKDPVLRAIAELKMIIQQEFKSLRRDLKLPPR